MVIVVGGQKGGTGKSSVATNLAVAAARRGQRTLLVDGDPQRTATRWHQLRGQQTGLAALECAPLTGALHGELLVARHSCDQVIVDLAGGDLQGLRTALLAADLLLLPLRPSSPDLWTAGPLDELARDVGDWLPAVSVRVLLSLAPNNPRVSELRDARMLLARHHALPCAETVLHERKAYRDALASGRGVLELDHEPAHREILALDGELRTVAAAGALAATKRAIAH